jgi:hypothetical protein
LFSKYINQKAVWVSLGVAYSVGIIIKLGFSAEGLFSKFLGKTPFVSYIQTNAELVDALIGLVIPVAILLVMEIVARNKGVDAGWQRFAQFIKTNKEDEDGIPVTAASKLPGKILVWAFGVLGMAVSWLAFVSTEQKKILVLFSIILLGIPAATLGVYLFRRIKNKQYK